MRWTTKALRRQQAAQDLAHAERCAAKFEAYYRQLGIACACKVVPELADDGEVAWTLRSGRTMRLPA